jgi:hypothetical protein
MMPQIFAGPKAHKGRKAHKASGPNKESNRNVRMIYSILTCQEEHWWLHRRTTPSSLWARISTLKHWWQWACTSISRRRVGQLQVPSWYKHSTTTVLGSIRASGPALVACHLGSTLITWGHNNSTRMFQQAIRVWGSPSRILLEMVWSRIHLSIM